MSKSIEKKPLLIHNALPYQSKTSANSLTIQEWNQVVNILKSQANLNTDYLEKLHRILFADWDSATTGAYEFPDNLFTGNNDGILARISELIEELKETSTVYVGDDPPTADNTVLWVDTSD